MLAVGLIGLPNVGKSTLFSALTAAEARASNYPFTTIDAQVGVVAVPDPRLEALAAALDPQEVTPSHLELIDIAGLVEGASHGEGLGNRFLGDIRQVDAILHVLRCFEDPDVAHVFAEPDARRDAEIVETELLLADLEVLGRAVEKRRKIWQTDPQGNAAERARLEAWLAELEAGRPLRDLASDAAARESARELGLLTAKPLLYVANLSESETGEPGRRRVAALEGALGAGAGAVVGVSASLERELRQLEPAERREFRAELGLETSALERVVAAAFERLGLIRFYTVVHDKLRAWEVERGTLAPRAAGQVHSDIERGFIRAEVVGADELVEAGGLEALKHAGKVRVEGKAYEVRDGDVMRFLFS